MTRHEGGHTPFSVDITQAARDDLNVVVVRAEDRLADKTCPRGKQYWKANPEGIFYTPTTGIWQTVWLEPLPRRHIRGLDLRADLDAGAVDFDVAAHGEVELTASLDGAVVGSWSGPAGRGRLSLNRVLPWRPEAPRLYDLQVRLFYRGQETDRVMSYFGLSKVGTANGQFLLNGEPYVQRLVLDQGYFPEGLLTAPSDAALRRDIELAKAFGFNGARKHQKIEDPRWLYWADVLGFLVWAEMPSFHEHSAAAEARLIAEWREAVVRDRSHPSIVAWVPANESFGLEEIDEAARARFLVSLYELTRTLDGTRPVISNDGYEHALSDLCTLHDYSGPSEMARRYRRLDSALQPSAPPHLPFLLDYRYRGEPIIVSEFGGVRFGDSGGWGYRAVSNRQEFVETYQGMIRALMDPGPVQGFCYTQLADVEQERNGLMTAYREPKVDPALIHAITQTPKEN
ncbi:MAG: glycoside hydrolase family 2 [Candidatus Dormibacteraeota bacterium]|nr:glycoside hydrolase family 2 [Candidatus Dormibacteraeota bacterium]